MTWRLARGLEHLRAQVNTKWSNRSKDSDGSIGDEAHASRSSDHNPWVGEARCLGQMQKPNERPMQILSKLSPSVFSSFIRNDVLIFDCNKITKTAT